MDWPANLKAAVDHGRERLAADPQGHLELGARQAIWAALGPRRVENCLGLREGGHQRRAALAIGCARRVLPFWTAAFPGDERPQQLLRHSEEYLRHHFNAPELRQEGKEAFSAVEQLIDAKHSRPAMALYAAMRASFCALYDETFDPEHVKSSTLDLMERDFWNWDSGFVAAAVAAGGTLLSTAADPGLRRAFWQWYLDEAVPTAWTLHP